MELIRTNTTVLMTAGTWTAEPPV